MALAGARLFRRPADDGHAFRLAGSGAALKQGAARLLCARRTGWVGMVNGMDAWPSFRRR
jgi:hypothetical protein